VREREREGAHELCTCGEFDTGEGLEEEEEEEERSTSTKGGVESKRTKSQCEGEKGT
jgi:hypothetical protein